MVRVLVVDDHSVVREGLKRFLGENSDITVAGEAGTGKEALLMVQKHDWDLVLLDIALQDSNGLDLLKQIKHARPLLPVLIFSMFAEDEYAMTALHAGAAGYVTKESRPAELLEAIHRITQGGRYLSAGLTEKLLTKQDPGRKKLPHEQLSNRETQILLLIAKGRHLTHIAEQLHLSVKTISTYRARILEKMKMESNAQLTRYVVQNRLDQ